MNTTTIDLGTGRVWRPRWKLSLFDGVFGVFLVMLASGVWWTLRTHMDAYEVAILSATVPLVIALGWWWKALRPLLLGVTAAVCLAIWAYQGAGQGELARADTPFVLKYFLSSQSALMWMSVLFFASTLAYWIDLLAGRPDDRIGLWASGAAWGGVFMALTGSLVRWYESYLVGTDVGHIPVSNLYEVFVLFAWLTTLMYLHQEGRYRTRRMGPWVMLVVSASVGFLIWYSMTRDAQAIKPLIPALQSWWMKIHVPANFVGYGGFAIAAMLATARLVAQALLPEDHPSTQNRSAWLARLPSISTLDDAMYRSIAVGFAFFTLATVLGALWAADAWGGYWSWDPKETWALIVWLNYAAWLHIRMIRGHQGNFASWWALVGLVVTTFAFIGVNMFLGGLHSYGAL